MSSTALLKNSVILSAYGESYYAFVFAPSLVVIYSLLTKKVVYKQSFAEDITKKPRPFTSLVASGNTFHVGLMDGRIFSFVKQEQGAQTKYKCIDSAVGGLPGYKGFWRDSSERGIELLGCDEQVLIYRVECKKLVVLNSASKPEEIIFKRPILKLRINSEEKMLLLVTKEKATKQKATKKKATKKKATKQKANFFLYKVSLDEYWNAHSRILLQIQEEDKTDCELMALSKNGDVALRRYGSFSIYKPLSGGKVPEVIKVGDCGNDYEGSACFVGEYEEMFAYSGGKYPEIAFAHCDYTSGVWSELVQHDEFELQKLSFTKDKNLRWRSTSDDTTIREVQFDGKNFVIRMEGHSEYENLLSFEYSEDGVLLDYDYTYLALRLNS
jgi:hypothetical protein